MRDALHCYMATGALISEKYPPQGGEEPSEVQNESSKGLSSLRRTTRAMRKKPDLMSRGNPEAFRDACLPETGYWHRGQIDALMTPRGMVQPRAPYAEDGAQSTVTNAIGTFNGVITQSYRQHKSAMVYMQNDDAADVPVSYFGSLNWRRAALSTSFASMGVRNIQATAQDQAGSVSSTSPMLDAIVPRQCPRTVRLVGQGRSYLQPGGPPSISLNMGLAPPCPTLRLTSKAMSQTAPTHVSIHTAFT